MGGSALDSRLRITEERKEFYARLGQKSAAPLWEVLAGLVTPEPRTCCVPAIWHYEDMRPLLMESGRLITAKEAERRVLVLENPALSGDSRITSTLYAGLQLVMPGETAPAHRHTASALRFVLESVGGYTAVEGERATLYPGDFVVTSSWTSHDHGNDTNAPLVWLDVLDIPLVNQFGCSFADHGAGGNPNEKPAPFSYPYSQSREALLRLAAAGPVHPIHGVRMQYVNPATGRYPMTTIATCLRLLPAGFSGKPYRSTDATVFCVAEGSGATRIAGEIFEWGPRDVFVVPSWNPVSHTAHSDAILFGASDLPVQKMLGIWREQA